MRTLNDPRSDAKDLYTALVILTRINDDLNNSIARIDILTKSIENIEKIIKKEVGNYIKSIGEK